MKLPQLSLRDLFWLVALAAMGCGWWVDRWQLNSYWDKLYETLAKDAEQVANDYFTVVEERDALRQAAAP